MRSTVVITAPTSTTNITGFFISVRGLSFTTQSHKARVTIPEVQRDFLAGVLFISPPGVCVDSGSIVIAVLIRIASENLSGMHQQVLQNRAQAERRKESERAHNQN